MRIKIGRDFAPKGLRGSSRTWCRLDTFICSSKTPICTLHHLYCWSTIMKEEKKEKYACFVWYPSSVMLLAITTEMSIAGSMPFLSGHDCQEKEKIADIKNCVHAQSVFHAVFSSRIVHITPFVPF